MTNHIFFQYLFLQAMTTEGESVLIPLTATFSTFSNHSLFIEKEVPDFFSSCTKLAQQINQSGSYPVSGKVQPLDYSDPLQPGIPMFAHPVLLCMDEELKKLIPDDQKFPFYLEQDKKDSREGSAVSASDNQLFSPETKGLFILEDPPEEGTPLYREEKIYFFRHPILFLRHTSHPERIIFHTFCGVALSALLIALKKGKIPHVTVG